MNETRTELFQTAIPRAHAPLGRTRRTPLSRLVFAFAVAASICGALAVPGASYAATPDRGESNCPVCDASATIIT